jgi:glycosyltransferase involved in cell wall biosynthesis
MRIGYVVKRYPRYSETFIVNEILAHEAAGLELEIFALRPPIDTHFQDLIAKVRSPVTYIPAADVKATRFWSELREARQSLPGLAETLPLFLEEDGADLRQALLLAQAMRAKDIGHLHAHFATVATTVARVAARLTGASYSFTAHAKDIFHESVEFDQLRRKQRDASGVVTVSDYNLQILHANQGAIGPQIRRIYNGLDLDVFRFRAPESRPPMIVSVGRLVEKKGLADLVEACLLLADSGRDFSCRIIGSGPLEEDLRARVAAAGLQDRVQLMGPRPQSEIIREVQAAAAFAAPCVVGADGNRDGLPTVLLEAMALGTPCVSTDVTGIPEVIRHEETGLMIPQHDPAALAKALDRLLADSGLRVSLAERARQLIERDFDVHRNAGRLRELFASAATARQPQMLEAAC